MGLFFRFSGKDGDSDARRRSPIRPFFLVLVVGLACWSFWTNSQQRMEAIAMQGLFTDELQALSGEDKVRLQREIKSFKKDFGIPLEVHIRKRPPAIETNDASRIYLDIVPSQGRAYLFLPPLLRRAVGEEFTRDMEMSFQRDFQTGDWHAGLVSVLLSLRAKVAEVTR